MLSSVPKFLILVIYALAKATSGICPAVPVTWILNRYGILKAALCKFALGVRSPGMHCTHCHLLANRPLQGTCRGVYTP
jgi:hypothetical protein